jgi:hypothetical protein
MSTLICDQTFHKTDNSRGRMINALLEITWNYEDNEFFVIG